MESPQNWHKPSPTLAQDEEMNQIFSEHEGRARLGCDRDDIKEGEGRNATGPQWGRDLPYRSMEGPRELEEY